MTRLHLPPLLRSPELVAPAVNQRVIPLFRLKTASQSSLRKLVSAPLLIESNGGDVFLRFDTAVGPFFNPLLCEGPSLAKRGVGNFHIVVFQAFQDVSRRLRLFGTVAKEGVLRSTVLIHLRELVGRGLQPSAVAMVVFEFEVARLLLWRFTAGQYHCNYAVFGRALLIAVLGSLNIKAIFTVRRS